MDFLGLLPDSIAGTGSFSLPSTAVAQEVAVQAWCASWWCSKVLQFAAAAAVYCCITDDSMSIWCLKPAVYGLPLLVIWDSLHRWCFTATGSRHRPSSVRRNLLLCDAFPTSSSAGIYGEKQDIRGCCAVPYLLFRRLFMGFYVLDTLLPTRHERQIKINIF